MKKNRILAVLLSMCMAMTLLAACSGGSDETQAPATDAATEAATEAAEGTEAATEAAGGDEGTGTASTASGTFKIGGIGPMTGDAAIYGTAVMNAAQIAVDEINAMGGIQFEFQPEDDEGDVERSVNAYNTLKDWGMQLLLGTVTTDPAISVSAEAYNDRMFMLTPSASSLDVIDGKDNVFQVCFTDPNQGSASAQYIAENNLATQIAVIYRNDDAYSTGIYNTFAEEAANLGLEIVYTGTFTADTATDFSVQLTDAQASGAELVFLPIYYTPAAVILTQANTMGYEPIFFGVDGMDGILTAENFDPALAEGVMLLTPFSADAEDELTQHFVSEYQSRYGETPNQFAADAYDAVYILKAALEAAGCTGDMSAEEICEALVAVMPTISVDGVTGEGMVWSETGEVNKAPMAVIIENGVYVTP